MRIGIDLDNTIIDYSGVFHRAAVECGWIDGGRVASDKNSVKEYFLARDEEHRWTELQGIVYGKTIAHAKAYSQVVECLKHWLSNGHQLFIISHKTRYPIIGDKLDFHLAALNWLDENFFCHLDSEKFTPQQVSFNPTIDAKVNSIAHHDCDVFIDDLEKIFSHQDFPANTRKILFSPNRVQQIASDVIQIDSWQALFQMESLVG